MSVENDDFNTADFSEVFELLRDEPTATPESNRFTATGCSPAPEFIQAGSDGVDYDWQPFPVEALPATVSHYVTAASVSIGCDPAFIAVPVLSCLSGAIGNTRRLRVKDGWDIPPVLWTATIAPSGSAKSPGLDAAIRPIEDFERLAGQQQSARTAQRCLVTDATIEAQAVLLVKHERGLLLYSDELSGWIGSFDRYSKAPKSGGDVARWLSIYGARSLRVDRKTGEPKHLLIPSAAISVTGTIQPGTLRRMITDEHRENGLLARLLLTMPPVRSKRWTEACISPVLAAKANDVFAKLLQLEPVTIPEAGSVPRILTLDEEARELWCCFYDEHNLDLEALPEGDLRAAWSKLEEIPARLALIIHETRIASGESISPDRIDAETMTAAITLTRWFCHETRRVYAMLAESTDEQQQRELVRLIQGRGGRITVRDLQRTASRKFKTSVEADQALTRLATANLGRWESLPASANGGAPSKVFVLLPE